MRIIYIVSAALMSLGQIANGQPSGIDLYEYLKPKRDTLVYNCVFSLFSNSVQHDTVRLVHRKIRIGDDTAYYISQTIDTTGIWAESASFAGSAMIFRNDSVLLASLTEGQSPTQLTKKDFSHIIPPSLKFSKPFDLAKLKWRGYVMEIFVKDFQFEDVTIDDTVVKDCLRLNLLVYDRSTKPDKATVWLSRDYGTVKWIRTTGRTEVLDLARFIENCR